MSSVLDSVLKNLEQILTLPSKFSLETNQIVYEPVSDCIVLTCGSLISETLYLQLTRLNETSDITCPVCLAQNVHIISDVPQLRDLYLEYQKIIAEINSVSVADAVSENSDAIAIPRKKDHTKLRRRSSSKKSYRPDSVNTQKMSLLTAFHEIVSDLNKPLSVPKSYSSSPVSMTHQQQQHLIHGTSPQESNVGDWIASMNDSTTLKSFQSGKSNDDSSTGLGTSVPIPSLFSGSRNASNLTRAIRTTTNVIPQSDAPTVSTTDKELLYLKNFPFFRKQTQHSTRSGKSLLKGRYSKLLINTDISPNLTRFVLLSERKFEVYSLDPYKPSQLPQLLCVGRSTGEYGATLDSLTKPSISSLIANSNSSLSVGEDKNGELMDKLLNWEHLYSKISDNLLVVAGTRGILRIFHLNQKGKPIYTYHSKFPIRCIDISNDEKFISIGITGKDKYTQTEQALIVLLKLDYLDLQEGPLTYEHESSKSLFSNRSGDDIRPQSTSDDFRFRVEPITVTLPYRDPINILKFSPNSLYLSCSTALESRFVIISIVNPDEPKLIMKSLRSLDTSLESEGITDLTFFPDNRWMAITSVAFNASPIIIDTRISSINSIQGIAQPLMLLRVDEVGSSIHKAEVSPRGDAILFLDRNGLVYMMSSPHMDDNENKRIVIVAEVTNAYRVREAATLRFDKEGYKLFILDRKGVLYIEDFAAGTAQSHDVLRCKLIC